MITKISIERLKKFDRAEIDIDPNVVLFVGQNNGGKTTALQAISLWSFLIQQWRFKKRDSKAKKRTGAPISRNEVYASPVRELKMLWKDGNVQDESSKKINIKIMAEGIDARNNTKWEYGIQLTYSNQELCFCKPIDHNKVIPAEADNVFHLPPLSGVQTFERRIDLGAQLRAVGEGRPGEILRNLLLGVYEKYPNKWEQLSGKVKSLFGFELQPIHYNPGVDPDIAVYYRPTVLGTEKSRMLLEIANAGSGFLQFLLLAAFLYAHEGAILLIDEPDSHMHVFLQRGVYDWLQSVASQNNSQLIVSTHSEVLVNSTDIDKIVAFFTDKPRKLDVRKNSLIRALEVISPLDVLNTEWRKRIFFAEGDTDLKILKSWAETLNHEAKNVLSVAGIFFWPLKTNHIKDALDFFGALKSIEPHLEAFCLRDKAPATQHLPPGFITYYWERSEIENYLIHPQSLLRFVEGCSPGELFVSSLRGSAEEYLNDNLPAKILKDPVNNSIPNNGSEFLEDFFKYLKMPISKSDYWQIAQKMKKEEIPNEAINLLDKLHKFLVKAK